MKPIAAKSLEAAFSVIVVWASVVFDVLIVGLGIFAAIILLRLVYRYWDRIW